MTIDVLLFHSAMSGAPAANLATAGALTALLDACLVDGWSVKGVSAITRSGDIATATLTTNNPFGVGDVVEVAGWDQAAYNGRFRVTAVTTSTIAFTVMGTPTTPGTGTACTAKRPGAGWTKQALGTNSVGYRTKLPGSQGRYLQVEDNNPNNDSGATARTLVAETLSGIDTAVSLGEKCTQLKGNGWVLVADGRSCYLISGWASGAGYMFGFGEGASFVPADNYFIWMTRGTNHSAMNTLWGQGWQYWAGVGFPVAACLGGAVTSGATVLKGAAQVGGPVPMSPLLPQFVEPGNGHVGLHNLQLLTLPSAADGSIPMCPISLCENGMSRVLRGTARGLFAPFGQFGAGEFQSGMVKLDEVVTAGAPRRMVVVRLGPGGQGQIAIDAGDSWD